MNRQIYEEASHWLVELRVGDIDAAARERLDAWFRASPEHVRAFLEVSAIWEQASDPDLNRAHSTDELIARARGAGTNVVLLAQTPAEFETRPTEPASTPQTAAHEPPIAGQAAGTIPAVQSPASPDVNHAHRLKRWPLAMAASVAVACVCALALYTYFGSVYSTSIGEQRTVNLPDGSRIELNVRSRVRVTFSKAQRDVELIAGQALFKVAKDASRPFVVQSATARVRAVGTEFDVNKRAADTVVTVIEGRVAVLIDDSGRAGAAPQNPGIVSEGSAQPLGPGSAGPEPTFLSAGEQATVTRQSAQKTDHPNVASATAWTQRELVFDRTPLVEVASEFNRYNEKPLIVSDAVLKDFHVTGVFSSTNPSSLLKFLRAQKGVRVEETDRAIQISKE